MVQKQKNTIAIIIISLYTITLLLCLYIFGYTPYPDSNGYISLAKECIELNTFYPQNLTDIPFLWNVGAINAVTLSLPKACQTIPVDPAVLKAAKKRSNRQYNA